MKQFILTVFFCNILTVLTYGQQSKYDEAMKAYEKKEYANAANLLDPFISTKGDGLSSTELYNSACIYAMANKPEEAFRLLNQLATQYFMSNTDRILSDSDLKGLQDLPGWAPLLERVKENQRTEPARTAAKIRKELSRVREILTKDAGKLWGNPLWNDDLLILDPKNKVYSLKQLPGMIFQDSLWTQTVPDRTLNQTNAPQDFLGRRFAVVLTSYLSDSSATLIHELFHVKQGTFIQLNGNPVNYLDGYQGREYLRLEYQALRTALLLAKQGAEKKKVALAIGDAIFFRKLRRALDPASNAAEIDIETSEGLANYTGFKLSDHKDKYTLLIREINGRENAPTYTRSFPYATGPAYGFLFDYLGMKWRKGLKVKYDFGTIYEQVYLHSEIPTGDETFKQVAARNNYENIHEQELSRKEVFERKTAWFTKTLVDAPVMRAKLVNDLYNRSFDMYGTFVLGKIGMVYTTLSGTDINAKNFGSFKTTGVGDDAHPAGLLTSFDGREYTFPLPVKIEGNKVTGPNYELILNEGWQIRKVNDKGDLEIVKIE